MNIPEAYRSYLFPDSRWLPAIDWNVKLYGAHMQRVSKGWTVPQESHHAFELILILKGTQTTEMENVGYELKAGDILLIPPGFKHVNRSAREEGLTYFVAHFNVDNALFRQEMTRHSQFYFPSGDETNVRLKAAMMKWIELLQERGCDYTSADLFRIQAGLFEIFGILAEQASAGIEHSVSPAAGQYARLIAEAIKAKFEPGKLAKYGENERDVRIEAIAVSLNISPGYALEVFQKVYGMSPRKYLSELKLHEAKQLILQPDLALSAVASLTGVFQHSPFQQAI
ncbi:AraC family ligand binding domain-containing protein [Paenibacillus thailandensis]|uniref:AraC family ligand binding domain-containing protein n=1 Tax=Paenibacillus thailandensis TaxID=393250 RepID=UPI003639F876